MRGALSPMVLAAFALAVIIGGFNFVAVRFSNMELAPFWGAALRFGTASLLLFTVVFLKRIQLPKGRDIIWPVLYGSLAFGATYAFLYIALLQVSAGLAAVIMALVPLLTIFLAFVHGLERIRMRSIIGGLISVGGIAVLFNNTLSTEAGVFYILAMLAGAFAAAESTVAVKKFVKLNPFVTNAIGMGAGAIILLVLSLISNEARALPASQSTWIALIYLILFGSIGLFTLFLFVLSKWKASATTYILVLMPITATIGSVWLENVTINAGFIIGGIIVLLGVYFGALAQEKKEEQ